MSGKVKVLLECRVKAGPESLKKLESIGVKNGVIGSVEMSYLGRTKVTAPRFQAHLMDECDKLMRELVEVKAYVLPKEPKPRQRAVIHTAREELPRDDDGNRPPGLAKPGAGR